MTESILNSTKKILGIAPEYTAFDLDILTHINSVFSTLWQIGVGPVEGFRVDDETAEWAAFLGDDLRLNQVKSYVYLRVRLLFDPPTTSFAIASLSEQAQEMAWRLQVITDPNVVIPTTDPEYIPGQF